MSEQNTWITTEEVAAHARCTPGAIYASRHRGDGPTGVRVGKRVLFRLADVDAWLESKREAAT